MDCFKGGKLSLSSTSSFTNSGVHLVFFYVINWLLIKSKHIRIYLSSVIIENNIYFITVCGIHDTLWIILTTSGWQTDKQYNIIIHKKSVYTCAKQPLSIDMRAQVILAYLISSSMKRLWRHSFLIYKTIFSWSRQIAKNRHIAKPSTSQMWDPLGMICV